MRGPFPGEKVLQPAKSGPGGGLNIRHTITREVVFPAKSPIMAAKAKVKKADRFIRRGTAGTSDTSI